MSPTIPDTARERLTVEYQPSQGENDHLPLLVANAELATTANLQPLLLKRLRFLSLGFALPYCVWVIFFMGARLLGDGWHVDDWNVITLMATVLVLIALAVPLWIRRSWSLPQLRAFECFFLAALAIRCLYRGLYSLSDPLSQSVIQGWRETGQELFLNRQLHATSLYITIFPILCMIGYGVFIPNTWRRCIPVVGGFWVIALITFVVVAVKNDIPARLWFEPGVVATFILLTFAAALAVFGSHRIETLRREVLQAQRLGPYIVRKKLGGGGMGEVYLADHVLLRRPCALKLIRPERANDPAVLQRFEREVQATATLTHPNAVQIFDYGRTDDGTFYYVMEYLPGLTLEQLVKEQGPLPTGRAIHFLGQLCGALHEAHSIGLIHRDIKPGNVMICERGRTPDVVKLLDFGLVQTQFSAGSDDRLTQEGAILGTPAYMSPEQGAGGETVDARSDIYSLGALAYFLLTGQPPFGARSPVKMLAAHLYEPAAPLTAHRSDVPAELEMIILRCLAKKPADRFQNVQGLQRALAECEIVSDPIEAEPSPCT